MTVNIGPHHPATHGVLRLVVDLEGEVVRDLKPVIGYVHTGIEKSCEDKSYWKVIPFVERMDYVSYFFQMEAFCGAVERLIELESRPGQIPATIFLELNRIHSHLVWLGMTALDLGAISMLWYCFRERDRILDLFEMAAGQRMHTRYFQVGGVIEDIPLGFEAKLREFVARLAGSGRPVRGAARPQRGLPAADQRRRHRLAASGCWSWASPARCCAPPASPGTCARPSTTSPIRRSTSRSRSGRSATTTTATGSGWRRWSSRRSRRARPRPDAEGPFIADDRKYVLPPRSELSTSMESLIHHFSSSPRASGSTPARSTTRSRARAGSSAASSSPTAPRSPRGSTSATPPSSTCKLPRHGAGQLHRRHDLQPRHARPDPRRGRPMSPSTAAAPATRTCRSTAPSPRAASRPRPGADPGAARSRLPAGARERIEPLMARYPGRKSASIPALWGSRSATAGAPRRDPPGRRGDGGDARLSGVGRSFYDLLHTARASATGSRSAPTSAVGCAAATSCSTPSARRRGEGLLRHRLRVPRRCDIAPMASIDQRYFGR